MAATTPESHPGAAKSGGISITRIVAGVVIVGLALWFVFANTRTATVQLWVARVSMPMWITLLVTFAAGWIVGLLFRRRKKD